MSDLPDGLRPIPRSLVPVLTCKDGQGRMRWAVAYDRDRLRELFSVVFPLSPRFKFKCIDTATYTYIADRHTAVAQWRPGATVYRVFIHTGDILSLRYMHENGTLLGDSAALGYPDIIQVPQTTTTTTTAAGSFYPDIELRYTLDTSQPLPEASRLRYDDWKEIPRTSFYGDLCEVVAATIQGMKLELARLKQRISAIIFIKKDKVNNE